MNMMDKTVNMDNLFDNNDYSDLLIPLKSGDKEKPIIFFHPISGTIACYCNFISKLKNNFPCYAIQAPKMIGSDVKIHSMENMASLYSQLIANNFSKVSLILVGWSFGGVIAYEVARKLKLMEEKVDSIVMIDACFDFPGHIYNFFNSKEHEEEKYLKLFYNDLAHSCDSNLTIIDNIGTFRNLFDFLKESSIFPIGESDYYYFERIYDAFKINVNALLNYQPNKFCGNVNHIIAKNQINNIVLNCDLWRSSTSGESKFFTAEGDHYSIMNNKEESLCVANIIDDLIKFVS